MKISMIISKNGYDFQTLRLSHWDIHWGPPRDRSAWGEIPILNGVFFGEVTWYPDIVIITLKTSPDIVIRLTGFCCWMVCISDFGLECRQHWKQLRPQPCECVAMDFSGWLRPKKGQSWGRVWPRFQRCVPGQQGLGGEVAVLRAVRNLCGVQWDHEKKCRSLGSWFPKAWESREAN